MKYKNLLKKYGFTESQVEASVKIIIEKIVAQFEDSEMRLAIADY